MSPKFPPVIVDGEMSERERLNFSAALGFARRQAKWPPDPSPHLPEEYAPYIEDAIKTLRRLGVWIAD